MSNQFEPTFEATSKSSVPRTFTVKGSFISVANWTWTRDPRPKSLKPTGPTVATTVMLSASVANLDTDPHPDRSANDRRGDALV